MNPLALAGIFGFVKGFLLSRSAPDVEPHWFHSVVSGPVQEEIKYRALPMWLGGNYLPTGWTAVPFALDHVLHESKHGMSTARVFARFTEVAFGGMLYELAYRKWGLAGAALAHGAHNAMTSAGVKAGRRVRAQTSA